LCAGGNSKGAKVKTAMKEKKPVENAGEKQKFDKSKGKK
jgi:hypothetical protein